MSQSLTLCPKPYRNTLKPNSFCGLSRLKGCAPMLCQPVPGLGIGRAAASQRGHAPGLRGAWLAMESGTDFLKRWSSPFAFEAEGFKQTGFKLEGCVLCRKWGLQELLKFADPTCGLSRPSA